jgi:GT2 family glycosyltransferase
MSTDPAFAGPLWVVDVAVIVVTYNSASDVEALLEDLSREAQHVSMRVVVVDNESWDATAAVVRRRPDVVFVEAGANLGYAGAINLGRTHIGRCAAVLILNPDLRIRPGAIAAMNENLADCRVGAVVPQIVDEEGRIYESLRREPSVTRAVGDALLGRHLSHRSGRWSEMVRTDEDYSRAHAVDWATGAAILIRSDVSDEVGEWEEEFFLYSEETDYMRRIRQSGALVWYEPAAVVQHRGAGSGSSDDLAALMSVNRIRYVQKYHRWWFTQIFSAAVILGEMLRATDPGHRRTVGVLLDRRRWARLPSARPVQAAPATDAKLGAIIVPAHNEAAVIARTLDSLAEAAACGAVEVIVVCNGCIDDTADIARQYASITVVDCPVASKVAALNLGDVTATLWPRIYLDADIQMDFNAVLAVFRQLRSGTSLAARPASRFDVEGSDVLVRSYYRARGRIRWFQGALWGAGAFGLSEKAHQRIGRFPALTGDDLWVDRQFGSAEKVVVDTNPVIVTVPRDYGSLLTMLRRVYRGKAEIVGTEPASRTCWELLSTVRGPASAFDAFVYLTISVVARRRMRTTPGLTWERDDSSRGSGCEPSITQPPPASVGSA